jgi:hypothetical protein
MLKLYFIAQLVSHLIYVNSIENNQTYITTNLITTTTTTTTLTTTTTTTITSTTTTSTTTTTTTTTTTLKILGLVGDVCTRVFGDCSKYMECKKLNEGGFIAFNTSYCQCKSDYLVDNNRECSRFLQLIF